MFVFQFSPGEKAAQAKAPPQIFPVKYIARGTENTLRVSGNRGTFKLNDNSIRSIRNEQNIGVNWSRTRPPFSKLSFTANIGKLKVHDMSRMEIRTGNPKKQMEFLFSNIGAFIPQNHKDSDAMEEVDMKITDKSYGGIQKDIDGMKDPALKKTYQLMWNAYKQVAKGKSSSAIERMIPALPAKYGKLVNERNKVYKLMNGPYKDKITIKAGTYNIVNQSESGKQQLTVRISSDVKSLQILGRSGSPVKTLNLTSKKDSQMTTAILTALYAHSQNKNLRTGALSPLLKGVFKGLK